MNPSPCHPTLVVPDDPESAPAPRVALAGRYELGDPLGDGPHGTVHRARDRMLGVDRAVLVLRGERTAERAAALARIRRDAHGMARHAHLHLLHVVDVGRDRGTDFVVSQLSDRGSVQDHLDREGPLPLEPAARAMIGVLLALGAAHRAGIVHRDVRPANLRFGPDGRVLLSDLGTALLTSAEPRRAHGFLAPEERLDPRSVGPAADVYAAGATLYAVVTGDNPIDLFTAPRGSSRWQGVPEPLRAILYRATRHDPAARYPSADAFASDLAQVLLTPAAPEVPPAGPRGAWIALAAIGGVALALTWFASTR